MMQFLLRFSVLAVFCCVLGGCGRTSKTSKLSSDDLNALQKRTFWSDKKTVFSSTVSVLQDFGYVVKTTDYAGGLITAENPASEGRKKTVARMFVSAFVEEFPNEGTAVRLNFVANSASGRRSSGDSVRERVVSDRELYRDIFDTVEQRIRDRQQIQLYQLQQQRN